MSSAPIPERQYESICNLLLNQRHSASECSHVRARTVQDCRDTVSTVGTGAGLFFYFQKVFAQRLHDTLHRAWPGYGRRAYTHKKQGDKLFCVGFRPKCRKAKTSFTCKFSAFTWESNFKNYRQLLCAEKSILQLLCGVRVPTRAHLQQVSRSRGAAAPHRPCLRLLGKVLSSHCAHGFSMVT